MGDMKEMKMQITPETPGRVAILNPFESPSDYYTLQEQIVSSPSVFKSTKSSSTPGKFRWSIDQLALINPVEIDSEDVRRQAMYLSHARIDKEMEDRRQKAIEEVMLSFCFITFSVLFNIEYSKSYWSFNFKLLTVCKSYFLTLPLASDSALAVEESRTLTFSSHLETTSFPPNMLLGEYFRTDEFADQSQENLSSSSLRRKLFLEENGNVSECLSPSLQSPCSSQPLGVLCSIDISPVRCRSPLETSGSGQFSSSPIQGGARAYSLGSITSPTFPEGSPAHNGSPTFSPIAFHIRKTPMSADQRKFTFCSPDIPSASKRMTPPSTRSPYIEGCSPIKNCSPMRLGACRGTGQYQASLIRIPLTVENHGEEEADKENVSPGEARFPEMGDGMSLCRQDGEAFACGPRVVVAAMAIAAERADARERRLAALPGTGGPEVPSAVAMAEEVASAWTEGAGGGSVPAGGFAAGGAFGMDSSRMCVSPLAESSALPADGSSLQVDSGYNTQTGGSSIMDIAGAENSCRENDVNTHVFQNKSQ
ncbi:BORA protein, partial [Nothocercus nigrocapillus]|nr:BORA protein [Nothocercus nigrocapillus]